ncbi:hypothetical protein EVAR_100581_1 [Eumeta japonica]|uniref:Uncharacterized protein n=1 Tax=Eumeta variegata TaxID=151549 RepID=A0A4C1YAX9_EUMVA|nr:hypothetical protein EVAR_100581_1 [Eumeta japonica]
MQNGKDISVAVNAGKIQFHPVLLSARVVHKQIRVDAHFANSIPNREDDSLKDNFTKETTLIKVAVSGKNTLERVLTFTIFQTCDSERLCITPPHTASSQLSTKRGCVLSLDLHEN